LKYKAPQSSSKIQPYEVEIDPTNACNQNCYYCNVHEFRKTCPDNASAEDYISLIRSLPDTVGKIVFSGGGEPLVSKDASKLIEEACKKNAEVGVITNGTMLHRLNVTKENHPDWIGIDIDAVDHESYFTIRKHNLDYVLNNVKKVVPVLKEMGIRTTFKYLITDYNNTWKHMEDAIDFASENGFDEFFARIAHFKDGHIITPITDWDGVRSRLKEYSEERGLVFLSAFEKEKLFIENKNTKKEYYSKCFGPTKAVIFCADGYTYWCTENRGVPEYRLGNWIEDGYSSIYKNNLLEEMENFGKHHKCNLQCKYTNISWKGVVI